jgi:AraC-like DNA-binding protein/predicted negative regulator of RcsB-dependent stress response
MSLNPTITRLTLLILLIFPSFSYLNAQNPQEYDSMFRKIFLEISQKDYEKSKYLADSLFQKSTTPIYQTKSLMLSASLCQQAGDIKEAIQYATKAEQYLPTTGEWEWKARVYGFLATQYRYVKLLKQSDKYVEKTIALTAKIEDSIKKNNLLGFVYQEKAYHEMDKKDFKKSISFVEKSISYFDKSQVQDPIVVGTNEQLLGQNYYYLGDFKDSHFYYTQALERLGEAKESYLYSLIQNGIANLYLDENKPEEAKKHLDEAYRISKTSTYLSLNIEVFKTLEKYFIAVRDYQNLKEIKSKRDSVTLILNKNSYSFLDQAFSGLENSKVETDKISKSKGLIIYGVSSLFILGLIYFIFYQKRKKKEYLHVKNALMELELRLANDQFTQSNLSLEEEEIESSEEASRFMTQETEDYLLSKLKEFEKSKLYLKKNMSLTYLASKLDTNTKYLSYVINKHKGQEFKSYIKELRILYILRKMEEDPQYLLYKISALSDETGFSSQSKFASAFKKITKVSPSVYVQHLKEKSEAMASN